MEPSVPRATLKVLGLCAALLLLVAAVTVAVAVLVWRSEALRKLQGCRERAANESRVLGGRAAALEQEAARLRRAAADGAHREEALQRLLDQARGAGERLNASWASCREHAAALGSNATALRSEVLALRRDGAELAGSNAALREELARSREAARGLQRRLAEATAQRRALQSRGERCEARQRELEGSLRDYAAEVEALQRRLSSRTAGRRGCGGVRAAERGGYGQEQLRHGQVRLGEQGGRAQARLRLLHEVRLPLHLAHPVPHHPGAGALHGVRQRARRHRHAPPAPGAADAGPLQQDHHAQRQERQPHAGPQRHRQGAAGAAGARPEAAARPGQVQQQPGRPRHPARAAADEGDHHLPEDEAGRVPHDHQPHQRQLPGREGHAAEPAGPGGPGQAAGGGELRPGQRRAGQGHPRERGLPAGAAHHQDQLRRRPVAAGAAEAGVRLAARRRGLLPAAHPGAPGPLQLRQRPGAAQLAGAARRGALPLAAGARHQVRGQDRVQHDRGPVPAELLPRQAGPGQAAAGRREAAAEQPGGEEEAGGGQGAARQGAGGEEQGGGAGRLPQGAAQHLHGLQDGRLPRRQRRAGAGGLRRPPRRLRERGHLRERRRPEEPGHLREHGQNQRGGDPALGAEDHGAVRAQKPQRLAAEPAHGTSRSGASHGTDGSASAPPSPGTTANLSPSPFSHPVFPVSPLAAGCGSGTAVLGPAMRVCIRVHGAGGCKYTGHRHGASCVSLRHGERDGGGGRPRGQPAPSPAPAFPRGKHVGRRAGSPWPCTEHPGPRGKTLAPAGKPWPPQHPGP